MLTISTVDDNDVIIDYLRTNFTEPNQPQSSLTSIMSRGELNRMQFGFDRHRNADFILDYFVFLNGLGLGLDNISFPSQSIS